MFRVKDLSEIGQLTRNESSKQYLEEAIASYRAGAYRAAIISTWIAVCVDIIEKIRELSLEGDKAASELEKKLNSIQQNDINNMLDFERNILDYACENIELISVIEKKHLERLKEDRNFCAHPTFLADGSQFDPSSELTKAYIIQASTYLLSRPPVKGKFAIDRLFNLISGSSFPVNDDSAYTILSSDNYLGKAKESTVRNLIIILLKRIFKDENGLDLESFERICSALGAIERIYNDIYIEVFKTKFKEFVAATNDYLIRRLFLFLIKRNEAWNYLEKATILRLETTISSMSGKDLNKYSVPKLASMNLKINDMMQSRINNFNQNNLKELLEGIDSSTLKEIAIRLFMTSGSFDSAYKNGVDFLLPHIKYFENSDIEILFDGILKNRAGRINQILHAGGMDIIFCQLYELTKKHNVTIRKDKWKDFYMEIEKESNNFDEFRKLLEKDEIIQPQESNDAINQIQEDEVPF
ncbi:hypothetical protein [Candidatus Electronema sp. JC]|uniref:hypothetical protein n=1 Tax=Candidatus Electronema sp. JC TaxID=3401570 RepID=UPI003B4341D9